MMPIKQRVSATNHGFVASLEDEFVPPIKQNNFWIILEGDENVGKSTLANALKHWLSLQNQKCVVEAFGKHFVPDPNLSSESLWMRFAAEFSSRMPFLQDLADNGWSIIQDRGFISTLVYQKDWRYIMRLMDALFHQWDSAPTHIFILPPYDRYFILRDVKRIILPISGREIYLIFVPVEADTLEKRVEFVLNALKYGVRYVEDDAYAERTVDTDEGDTEDGTGGDADGEGVEVGGGLGSIQFSPTATELSHAAFSALTNRTQSSNETVDATTANDMGGVVHE
ncbi:MAG: hypothetical protein QXO09_06165 [Candidatus Caldarchaeum sp.]